VVFSIWDGAVQVTSTLILFITEIWVDALALDCLALAIESGMESVVSLISIRASADRLLFAIESLLAFASTLIPSLLFFADSKWTPRSSWNEHLLTAHRSGPPLLIQYVELALIDTLARVIRVQSISGRTPLPTEGYGLAFTSLTAELIVDTLAQSISAEAFSPLTSFELLLSFIFSSSVAPMVGSNVD